MPTQHENFGHVILETLNCSLPIIISDNTPWRNLEEDKSGFDLPLTNQRDWENALQKFYEMPDSEYQAWRRGAWEKAQKQLNQPELKEKYIQLFS